MHRKQLKTVIQLVSTVPKLSKDLQLVAFKHQRVLNLISDDYTASHEEFMSQHNYKFKATHSIATLINTDETRQVD